MPHIVVIGAGISGLSTAFHVQEAMPGTTVTVLESNNRAGGTIWTERTDGFQFEIGPNGFLDTKPTTKILCERLGIAEQLIAAGPAAKKRYLFLGDRLQMLPGSLWQFVRSPLLSWRSKFAYFRERFRRCAIPADESVHDFAVRRTNEEIANMFADALVTGIHAGDPKLLSFPASFPRINQFERQFGSVQKGMKHAAKERRREAAARGEMYESGRLLSFQGGMRVLIESLRDRLRTPPLVGVAVRRITSNEPHWRIHGEGKDHWDADAVVLACPAHVQAAMVADLDQELAEAMNAIPYAPVAVVALGFRQDQLPGPLDGFGFIAPQRTRRDILGVQWCSSIYPDRAPDGMVLMRVLAGGWNRRDIVTWSDDQLMTAVRAELRISMKIEAPPIFHRIIRWPNAIPQYHLGHLDRVARIEHLLPQYPGLFVTGNAYHGIAMNDCTEQGEIVAGRVVRHLASVAA